jgi:hypothetical protein
MSTRGEREQNHNIITYLQGARAHPASFSAISQRTAEFDAKLWQKNKEIDFDDESHPTNEHRAPP